VRTEVYDGLRGMALVNFIKKETVLFISIILAAGSLFAVPPDSKYADYVDFKTICILFSLMSVMEGLKKTGVFSIVSENLLRRAKSMTAIVLILVYLCFGFSMFITNDVALITFVPLALAILRMTDESVRCQLLIPVITMQTIAANLGSMLLPTGNPQNLYLYGLSGMKLPEFILLLLPFSLAALVIITIWSITKCRTVRSTAEIYISDNNEKVKKIPVLIYFALFVICVLSVAGIVHYFAATLIVLAAVLIYDVKVLKTVDYSLLLTFVCFFIFIGNIGRIDAVNEILRRVTEGSEFLTSVIASQAVSNVPCAILLSGFTENYRGLIVGTNIGGLGTLIASMASLISFKYISNENPNLKKKYFIYSDLDFHTPCFIRNNGLYYEYMRIK